MPMSINNRYAKALAATFVTKFPIVEIRNDVTRKPGAKLAVKQSTSAAARRRVSDTNLTQLLPPNHGPCS